MARQRLRLSGRAAGWAARAVATLVGAVILFYAAGLLLLALKVSPATVDAATGYSGILDFLGDLRPADATGQVRLIAGLAGLAAFGIFGFLAWRELPRPRLARHAEQLDGPGPGTLLVRPRAIERAAETAACRAPDVAAARARLDEEELVLEITVSSATALPALAAACEQRVSSSFDTHGLPAYPVALIIGGFEPSTRKALR